MAKAIKYETNDEQRCITPCPHKMNAMVGAKSCVYACKYSKAKEILDNDGLEQFWANLENYITVDEFTGCNFKK